MGKKSKVLKLVRTLEAKRSKRSSSVGSARSRMSGMSGSTRKSRSGSAKGARRVLDGTTPPSSSQPTRGGIAKPTSSITKRQMDDAYLAGFLDPCSASRGPGMADDPTIVSTFSSTQNIVLTNSSGAIDAPWPASTTLTCDPNGNVAVLVGPVAFASKVDGTVEIRSGYTCPSNRRLTDYSFPTLPPVGQMNGSKPLGRYRQSAPGTFQIFSSPDWNPARDGIYSMAFRILGIKATLTVVENAFTATGEVFAGDTASYYPDPPVFKYSLSGATPQETTSVSYSDNADMFARAAGFDDGRSSQRIVPVGAFETGRTFEAVYLPTSPTISTFRSMFPIQSTGSTGTSGTSIGQAMLDGPFVVFILTGTSSKSSATAATTNFVLNSEVAMEWIVKYDNPFALLMGEARYMPSWIPDFSRLAGLSPGGRIGHVAAAYSGTELHGHYVKHPVHVARHDANRQAAALGKALIHTSTVPHNAVMAEAIKRKPTSTLQDILAFAKRVGPDVLAAVRMAKTLTESVVGGSAATRLGPIIEEVAADAPLLLM